MNVGPVADFKMVEVDIAVLVTLVVVGILVVDRIVVVVVGPVMVEGVVMDAVNSRVCVATTREVVLNTVEVEVNVRI